MSGETYVGVLRDRASLFCTVLINVEYKSERVTPRDLLARALQKENKSDLLDEYAGGATYITFEDGSTERRVYMDEALSVEFMNPDFLALTIQLGPVAKWLIMLQFIRENNEESPEFKGLFNRVERPASWRVMLGDLMKDPDVEWDRGEKPKTLEWLGAAFKIIVGNTELQKLGMFDDLTEHFGTMQMKQVRIYRPAENAIVQTVVDMEFFPYKGPKREFKGISWNSNALVRVNDVVEAMLKEVADVDWESTGASGRIYIDGTEIESHSLPMYAVAAEGRTTKISVVETAAFNYVLNTSIQLSVASPGKPIVRKLFAKTVSTRRSSLLHVIANLMSHVGFFSTKYTIAKRSVVKVNGEVVGKDILTESVANLGYLLESESTVFIDVIKKDESIAFFEQATREINAANGRQEMQERAAVAESGPKSQIQARTDLMNAVSRATDIALAAIKEDRIESHGVQTGTAKTTGRIAKRLENAPSLRNVMQYLYVVHKALTLREDQGGPGLSSHAANELFDLGDTLRSKDTRGIAIACHVPGHANALIAQMNGNRTLVISADPSASWGSEYEVAKAAARKLANGRGRELEFSPTMLPYQIYDTYVCGIGGGHCFSFSHYIIVQYVVWNDRYLDKAYSFDEMHQRLTSVAALMQDPNALLRIVSAAWPRILEWVTDTDLDADSEQTLTEVWAAKAEAIMELPAHDAFAEILNAFKVAYYDLTDGKQLNWIADVMFLDMFLEFGIGLDKANEVGTRILIILEDLVSKQGVLPLNRNIADQAFAMTCRQCGRLGRDMQRESTAVSPGTERWSFCDTACQREFYAKH